MGNKDIKKKTDRELLEELVKGKRSEERKQRLLLFAKICLIAAVVCVVMWKMPKAMKKADKKKKETEAIMKILNTMYAAA